MIGRVKSPRRRLPIALMGAGAVGACSSTPAAPGDPTLSPPSPALTAAPATVKPNATAPNATPDIQRVREGYLTAAHKANEAMEDAAARYRFYEFADLHNFCVAKVRLEKAFRLAVADIAFPAEMASDVEELLDAEAKMIAHFEKCADAKSFAAIDRALRSGDPTELALRVHDAAIQVRLELELPTPDVSQAFH